MSLTLRAEAPRGIGPQIQRRAFLAALVAAAGLPKLAAKESVLARAYRTGTLGDVGFDWYEQLLPAEPDCEWCFELCGHIGPCLLDRQATYIVESIDAGGAVTAFTIAGAADYAPSDRIMVRG